MKPRDARDSIAFSVHRYARLQRRHFLNLMAETGIDLSQEQWFILNRLRVDGPQSQVQLTDEAFADRPNLTRMIAKLERKRLLRRTQDPDDGRRMICSLTKLGEGVHARVAEAAQPARERLFAGLTVSDVNAFCRVLRHLEERTLDDHVGK